MSPPGEHFCEVADSGLLVPVVAGTAGERLAGDQAIATAMVTVEAALVRALIEAGIAPESARQVADAVAATEVDARALALEAGASGSPVVPLVPRLRDAVPEAYAAWVHYGATSQDILDTALMLAATRVVDQTTRDLTRLATTLAPLARRHRDVPMVARTLTQQAMPTTLGMRVATWLAGTHDAIRTLRACVPLPVSLGGPVGTNATYGAYGPAVAEALAAELGLRAPVMPWHTRRVPVLDIAGTQSVTGAACGKIAADVLVMSQTEIGEATEGAGGSSSAMAHKANPAQSILVASAARQLPALVATLTAAATSAEQERPAGAWHAEWQPLRALLRLSAAAAERTADMVAALRFDTAAMARNLDRLVETLGQDDDWISSQTKHAGVWIDRVLAQHEEVLS